MEEKIEVYEKTLKLVNELTDKYIENDQKRTKSMRNVVVACLISMLLMAGGFLYYLGTFEMVVEESIETIYEQSSNENSSIINGNQFNDNSQNNK